MKLQKITNFFEKLFQSLSSIFKIVILSKWFVNFKKHSSEETECVILGNGPLLTEDLEKHFSFINSKKKFCVNFFALSKEYVSIKPDYYILAAPEFWLTKITNYFKTQRN